MLQRCPFIRVHSGVSAVTEVPTVPIKSGGGVLIGGSHYGLLKLAIMGWGQTRTHVNPLMGEEPI